MGKIGKTYAGAGGCVLSGRPEMMRFSDRSLGDPEQRTLRHQVTAAVVWLICVLGLIGWAFTL